MMRVNKFAQAFKSRLQIMKSIDQFRLPTAVLKRLYLNKIIVSEKSQDLGRIIKKHPKLVIALNHGPMAGALAGLIGVTEMFLKHGGATRRPFGITWRGFYDFPISKQVLAYLTQVDKGVNFDEASHLLTNTEFTDCFIMPEGELCNVGNGLNIQAFLSPRFIELAIRSQTPVLIVAHQGSEDWAWPVPVHDKLKPLLKWLPKNIKDSFDDSGIISIPKPFRKKLDKLYMSFHLYRPKLDAADLASDMNERMIQLNIEAEKVRKKMQKMVNQLSLERAEESQNTSY